MKKTAKKANIVIFLSIGVLAFILIFSAIFLLGRENTQESPPKYNFIFHEVDFETDILSDPEYLALDRSISLKQGSQTVTIDESYRSENGTIEFMLEYIDCIIAGDYVSYKNFFSEIYFETETVPEIFTMQRIYQTTIEFISETPVAQSNKNYTEYRLSLDYKINRNDGTLRNDMNSDCFRTQYFLITNREGSLKIDTIKTFDIVDEIPTEQIDMAAAYVGVAFISLIIAMIVIVIVRKRTAKRICKEE